MTGDTRDAKSVPVPVPPAPVDRVQDRVRRHFLAAAGRIFDAAAPRSCAGPARLLGADELRAARHHLLGQAQEALVVGQVGELRVDAQEYERSS